MALFAAAVSFAGWNDPYDFPAARDAYLWPFSQKSIWNTPIGGNARYVPANIPNAMASGMTVDEDIIILKPAAPLVSIWEHNAGWDPNKVRCNSLTGNLLYTFKVPVPDSFSTDPGYDGITPNMGAAILMPDGRTIKQNQPFHRCGVKGKAVSQYRFADVDLYGDGTSGAHGGSTLSAIGGTLRAGELVPDAPPIHHVLKVNLNLPSGGCSVRWPAANCDGASASPGYFFEGALLAIPATSAIDGLGLETEPAKYLARALQDYGAYVVDNTAWDVYAIETEWGPDGRVIDEFQRVWGFSIAPQSKNTPWARDMDRIFAGLNVVDNNSASSIGGGGTPRAPLAPPFGEGTVLQGKPLPPFPETASGDGEVFDLTGKLITRDLSVLSRQKDCLTSKAYFVRYKNRQGSLTIRKILLRNE
jgi:hypothetical protein